MLLRVKCSKLCLAWLVCNNPLSHHVFNFIVFLECNGLVYMLAIVSANGNLIYTSWVLECWLTQ